jgi:hypothetical protein
MKKVLFIFFIILLIPQTTLAVSEDRNENTTKKINSVDQIKNKVASRVAELKLVEKRGIVGIVESVDNNQIRINDLNGKTRIIDVDELTKFSSSDSDNFDISYISKGTKISTIGLYNKESERLLARFVNEINIPIFLAGVISDKNNYEFTLELITEDGKNYNIDIENTTKSYSISGEELENTGFSKMDLLKNALVFGFKDPKNENRISATKIIVFPQLPHNPKIVITNKSSTKFSKTVSPSPTP